MKKEIFEFKNEWFDAFGNPERTGTWFIYGNSTNGKSDFVMQLVKELCRHEKVVYNSLEEGLSKSFQDTLNRNMMEEQNGLLKVLDREPIEEFRARLAKKKSPNIAVIDSIQTIPMSTKMYFSLKEQFNKEKLLILISQADGKQPLGRPAANIQYYVDLKIWVEGNVAISKGRFIGSVGKYVAWPKGAEMYHGKTIENEN